MTKTERVFRLFGQQIAQEEFAPGALPSEAELCRRFDVSRNVMREVARMLSTKRLVDAPPHRGLFVMPSEQWNYLDADVLSWVLEKKDNPAVLRSLIEVRRLIEPSISRWAAERATAVDLVEIEAGFHAMEANRDHAPAFHEADILLHRAVLAASHNLIIGQLSDAISALQRAIFNFTQEPWQEHIDTTLQLHLELFEAIRCKNPEAAEDVSRRMVTSTANRAIEILDGNWKEGREKGKG